MSDALPLVAPRDHPLLQAFTDTQQEPLGEQFSGKLVVNPAFTSPHGNKSKDRSDSYDAFPDPIFNDKHGFDIHIYYPSFDSSITDVSTLDPKVVYALALRERIRKEFPELPCYRFWSKPIGPHPTAMFEINATNPHSFGAIVAWLTVNRGDLSVLIHPNTDDEVKDHATLGFWMGEKVELDIEMLRRFQEEQRAKKAAATSS